MKVELKFAKHIKKPKDIRRFLELNDISRAVITIIDENLPGLNIVNYKKQPICKIRIKRR